MTKEIEKYSDITDDDCTMYKGTTLKSMYSTRNGFHQLRFESVKHDRSEGYIYHPYEELEDDKLYKCFEYTRVSGAGIEYTTISIMNYKD